MNDVYIDSCQTHVETMSVFRLELRVLLNDVYIERDRERDA